MDVVGRPAYGGITTMNRVSRGRIAVLLSAGLLLLLPGVASAFSLIPTESEWLAWPEYCRAKYAKTMLGQRTEFAGRISRAEIQRWNEVLGEVAFTHIHHHCAAMTYFNRSRFKKDPNAKKEEIRNALNNSSYAIQRIPVTSPVYSEVALNHAMILDASGEYGQAQKVLESLVSQKPEDSAAYTALAYLYASHGKKTQAREILEKGDAAVDGKSIDIHYNLGLICADLGDYDCATRNAKLAYEAGHPLPGLRQKLVAAGKWDSGS
jgi:tetratricopeptide (TPR) repeat protein